MKKAICWFLSVCLILFTAACRNDSNNVAQPVNFYYLNTVPMQNSETAIISPEVRDRTEYGQSLDELLALYLQGPVTEGYITPFPANTRVLEHRLEKDHMAITLSQSFAQLKGMDLTLACACLAKTITELTNCQTVEFSVRGTLLDGKASILMDLDHLLVMDKIS